MKITEKQLLIMLRVLEGSLRFHDRSDINPFGYVWEVREDTYNQIVNQQSDKLVDVEGADKGDDDYFYCQEEIEGREKCEKQCDHCEEYYRPLVEMKGKQGG